jgi:hypothetical protein
LFVLALEGDQICAITLFATGASSRTSDCRGCCDREGWATRLAAF